MVRAGVASGAPRVRWRADLEVAAISHGLRTRYVIKDPVTLRYFHCEDYELQLLQQFDGHRSLDDVRRWFERTFSPLRLSSRELHELIWQRYSDGLLTSTAAGQSDSLQERRRAGVWKGWWTFLRSPWVVRLPGCDPTWLLKWTEPLFGWVFSLWFVAAMLPLFAAAFVGLVCSAEAIHESLPSLQAFLGPANLVWLMICIAFAKALHELGHATAARRFGCECHELGVLLLVGIPTLYCDVSDAWRLPQRGRRIAISLAGIWVELLLALACAGVWWFSVPGLVHSLSFNLMLVCSASTLLFNANPLLRYDGYYVLMDLTETPNLAQRGSQAWQLLWQRVLLGAQPPPPADCPPPLWLAGYGALSGAYRVLIAAGILLALHTVLKPAGGEAFVGLLAVNWLALMAYDIGRTATAGFRSARREGASPVRVAVGLTAFVAFVVGAGMTPWPWYLCSDAVLEPVHVRPIYAQSPGQLVAHAQPGERVAPGQQIARLENPDLSYRLRQLEGDCEQARVHLQALEARRGDDADSSTRIPAAQARLASLVAQRELLRRDCEQLAIVADCAGVIVPPPLRTVTAPPDALPTWEGQLLDELNRGAWVDAGQPLLQIADPAGFDAVAIVAQESVERLAVGQAAEVQLTGYAERLLPATVHEISRIDLQQHAEGLVLPESVEWVVAADGRRTLAQVLYQVRLRLSEPCPAGASARTRARARVLIGRRTAWGWLWDNLHRTFRWTL